MAGAGAGASVGEPSIRVARPLFANGHGEQCIVPGSKKGTVKSARVEFTLPEGVHVITIQEAGKSALVMAADALRATVSRSSEVPFNPKRIALRPRYGKQGHEDLWCKSKFMQFKHEIAMIYRVVEAVKTAEPTRNHEDLFNFVRDERYELPKEGSPKLLTFNQLFEKLRVAGPGAYGGRDMIRDVCDLYDRRIHIRHPGDRVANNLFTPISYILGEDNKFSDMDGACGLVAYDTFDALGRDDKASLVKRYTLDELNKNPAVLPTLYRASIFPTSEDIQGYINHADMPRAIGEITDDNEETYMGKVLVALNRGKEGWSEEGLFADRQPLKKTLEELVQLVVETYKPTNDNPVVLYYPLCRVFDVEPSPTAVKLARTTSLQEETGGPMWDRPGKYSAVKMLGKQGMLPYGGRRRKTYRKKKLRTQTRRRRQ